MVIEMNKSIMIGTATALLSIFLLLFYLTPYTYQKSGDHLLRINRLTGVANLYVGDQWVHVQSPKEVAAREQEKEKAEEKDPIYKLDDLLYGEGVTPFDNIESLDGLYRLPAKRSQDECKAGITVYDGKTDQPYKGRTAHFQLIGNELVQCMWYPYKLYPVSKDFSIAFPWARKEPGIASNK
jgi:hypothetical protein